MTKTPDRDMARKTFPSVIKILETAQNENARMAAVPTNLLADMLDELQMWQDWQNCADHKARDKLRQIAGPPYDTLETLEQTVERVAVRIEYFINWRNE